MRYAIIAVAVALILFVDVNSARLMRDAAYKQGYLDSCTGFIGMLAQAAGQNPSKGDIDKSCEDMAKEAQNVRQN